jgi:diphthamide biosynthesis protein 3
LWAAARRYRYWLALLRPQMRKVPATCSPLSSPTPLLPTMADEELNLYDEIEIEDCFYDSTLQIYHHPCPCGDRFEISIADMRDGEDIARCPSCSLMIRIIFDAVRPAMCNGLRTKLTVRSRICPPRMTMRLRPLLSLRRGWICWTVYSLNPSPPEATESSAQPCRAVVRSAGSGKRRSYPVQTWSDTTRPMITGHGC